MESHVFSWLVGKVNEPYFVDMGHLEHTAIKKAKGLAVDYIRRQARSPVVSGGAHDNQMDMVASQEPNPAEELERRDVEREEWESVRFLMDWLRSNDPKQHGVLRCIVMEQKTQPETAEELGLPIGTVGTYLHRGLEKIRKEIQRHPHLKELRYPKLQLTLKIILLAWLIK